MIDFNSVRVLFPKSVIKAKLVPKVTLSTQKSRVRQAAILELVNKEGMSITDLVIKLGCIREQMRYDIRTMLKRGELINLSTGKQPYFVIAA